MPDPSPAGSATAEAATPYGLAALTAADTFAGRHIGPDPDETAKMLAVVGYGDLEALLVAAVPSAILDDPADFTRTLTAAGLTGAASEADVSAELRAIAAQNRVTAPMIGMGYSGTITPAVLRRNVLESPAWYTAYTPYQPEISQGRLEALLNFQTVVGDLCGLPIANASLLDEATAAAEGMTLALRSSRAPEGAPFLVDSDSHPQTRAVLATRAEPLGVPLVDIDVAALLRGEAELPTGPVAGALLSYPSSSGAVRSLDAVSERVHAAGGLVVVATDLLALTLLRPPGEMGADIAVGSAQRFGVPMGFGGPHAGFMAVRAGLERGLPGRLVGVSVDADGAPALRLALQTREQHIRREKATSNICTAQVLLAVVAGLYAAYHGPRGLAAIARRTHRYAVVLATGLRAAGLHPRHEQFFDTVTVDVPDAATASRVAAAAHDLGVSIRQGGDSVGISCSEVTTAEHIAVVWRAFGLTAESVGAAEADSLVAAVTVLDRSLPGGEPAHELTAVAQAAAVAGSWAAGVARESAYLTHPVFHAFHSETDMLRYLRRLADRDVALDRSMIPLGSCTMKLNGTTEMEPITWPGFADLHPYAVAADTGGYQRVVADLESWLAAITGYDAVSVQPNAGSQGEFAGLLAVRAYHRSRGDEHRTVCLIPSSAHGTNAASAVMAGLDVVVVGCDAEGNVDLLDLRAKIERHADRLAVLMVTYPSTHGVYEQAIGDICAAVHDAGGQVYVDGANLNALVGVARPGRFGADVSHLNLHKTFCIPHGGGGPGVGPVAVRRHLAPFLPAHPLRPAGGPVLAGSAVPADGRVQVGPVSAAPFGSASILPISWAYVRLMGAEGLRHATAAAVLAANYVARRLAPHYPVLYTGANGLVAHECIVDVRGITKDTGVTVEDVAKRLVDYGFHAPTMSFPVAGTLMIEPTESEGLAELDRFCDAMIAIRAEIAQVADGAVAVGESMLRHAPHTAASLLSHAGSPEDRIAAAFPAGLTPDKYWPPVRRIDGARGDRQLVCSCPPVQEYGS